MRVLMAVFLTVAVSAASLVAIAAAEREVVSGHLMPFKCQNDDKPTHTRDCALRPECRVTGYGIALADGTFLQFDADSNKKAAQLLERSTKASDLIAEAEGERVGPLFRVRTIRLK